MISTEKKPTRKKFKGYINNVGKKDYTLANKTTTLTKKKGFNIYMFKLGSYQCMNMCMYVPW